MARRVSSKAWGLRKFKRSSERIASAKINQEADLRLLPAPDELLSGVLFLEDDVEALAAVDAFRSIETLRMIEYFDSNSLGLLRERYSEVPLAARAAVLIEQIGDDTDPWEAFSHRGA